MQIKKGGKLQHAENIAIYVNLNAQHQQAECNRIKHYYVK